MEKGNITEGKMIPVWDFFGSERIYYADLKEPYVEDGSYNSYLTINAMEAMTQNHNHPVIPRYYMYM